MLRQFFELKEQVPDCILFFRMGDFYEMFFEDAVIASKVLSIALTSRDKGHPDPIPMCGVPYRAVDAYLAKMVEAGHKVAVCDQVEDPKLAKGLVKREITRVVSPGMFTDPNHLPARDHRYLAALFLGRERLGLACLDLASGEFMATTLLPGPALADELARLDPAELVMAESQAAHPGLGDMGPGAAELPRSLAAGRPPTPNQARQTLEGRLPEEADEDDWDPALIAASLAWSAVLSTQRTSPEHIEPLSLYQVETHLVLDATAQRNLELYRAIAGGGRKGSLLNAVDHTATPMGGRLLKQWLGFPLRSLGAIEARHQAVEELVTDPLLLDSLQEALAELPDLPRLVGRASLGQATPRDLASLRDALLALPGLRALLEPMQSALVASRLGQMGGLGPLATRLYDWLAPSPPASLAEGGVIAKGVSDELDQLRQLRGAGKDWIAALQAELRASTGIPSLKVSFNKVFGYYIEVTRTHLEKVPESFIRKQTLANAERYITPELKDKEAAVLGADEKALDMEKALFEQLRQAVAEQGPRLVAAARAVAEVDVLAGLARLALSRDYVRPVMSQSGPLSISAGRHPVVEQMLADGEFVPNDVHLDDGEQQVLIITGPNMAGKSTILRQVALICLLAQAGSFVPAAEARLPLIDRIFTRVGAMDDLAGGRSTFMVEMTETSQILAAATPRSLVILDEVGRGTSTFDGLSLAWAVAEHLHDLGGAGVKTLFATHYHELTELAATHQRVKNFNVAVKEYQGSIVFLRRLAPGGVSRSYGLAVARLAGLPEKVLARAREILARLEQEGPPAPAPARGEGQLTLFTPERHPLLDKLAELDLSAITPLQALNLISEWQHELD
ncbi:MAG: DNA mismatch repair protein MutS [Desulfarculaceae bacterium]|nr:DNA mismatch repair protein MutS [Desulfarculaceae bacterium]MCF8071844.1 DNA mismatch repair protein MutS [Desulfarculaceae bacterium]MCF8101394.1 DNA mismatch repair protein MutS [Desulfarculaceae bacterium]MCF8117385.1 DNA mismatch repair protein MutS [Desulfarculaceae bacterium]